jgi:hypothetical protein
MAMVMAFGLEPYQLRVRVKSIYGGGEERRRGGEEERRRGGEEERRRGGEEGMKKGRTTKRSKIIGGRGQELAFGYPWKEVERTCGVD